jgi:hypothetical protein
VNKYAEIYLQAMKYKAPNMYRELKASGKLMEVANEVGEECAAQVEAAVFGRQSQLQDPTDYLKTVQQFTQAHREAEEVAIAQMCEFPEEPPEETPDRTTE